MPGLASFSQEIIGSLRLSPSFTAWHSPTVANPAGWPRVGAFARKAGGLTAISRWLSGAIPPETVRAGLRIPEGCQPETRVGKTIRDGPVRQGLRSLRDRARSGAQVPGVSLRSTPG